MGENDVFRWLWYIIMVYTMYMVKYQIYTEITEQVNETQCTQYSPMTMTSLGQDSVICTLHFPLTCYSEINTIQLYLCRRLEGGPPKDMSVF